jgi:hypothetical protein
MTGCQHRLNPPHEITVKYALYVSVPTFLESSMVAITPQLTSEFRSLQNGHETSKKGPAANLLKGSASKHETCVRQLIIHPHPATHTRHILAYRQTVHARSADATVPGAYHSRLRYWRGFHLHMMINCTVAACIWVLHQTLQGRYNRRLKLPVGWRKPRKMCVHMCIWGAGRGCACYPPQITNLN